MTTKCPSCGATLPTALLRHATAVDIGSRRSPKKAAASRENGKRGGRPRKGLSRKGENAMMNNAHATAGHETRPKLITTALYLGDNGRCFCGALRCAGMSAHFTGRDISGQRVYRPSKADARKAGLACEGCGLTV